MRQNRRPGERLFVDYAGMTIPVFLDGIGHDAQMFVVCAKLILPKSAKVKIPTFGR